METKEFIQKTLINGIGELVPKQAYFAFALIAVGIEFLGKCLDTENQDWNKSGMSKIHFELVINKLNSFERYRKYLEKYSIWNSYRNGFAHSFVPKAPISLSSGEERIHLDVYNRCGLEWLNFKCEDFYEDFKNACFEVINMNFENHVDKMNKDLLSVPPDFKIL